MITSLDVLKSNATLCHRYSQDIAPVGALPNTQSSLNDMRPYGSALLSTRTGKFSPSRSIQGIRAYSTRGSMERCRVVVKGAAFQGGDKELLGVQGGDGGGREVAWW
ncbi:hypothetical protein Tco_0838112 [Tanacetum coccineum]|uniref:Uncharacterized protein n=1 Tax=Tanacetum coccineum TaxID=301880 RepID=A0ABQ5ALU6_9ASTR